jgi:acyl transferase domain-containing protein/ubiquinone/menaquinone biosynthesis C-methylase UbiE
MNDQAPTSQLRRAFLKIEDLEARLQAEVDSRTEPLALVGMGCRLPGEVESPAALWQLLASGHDATGEIPTDRWNIADYFDPQPGIPGKMYTTRGGFLRNVDGFDAAFFGISPREAIQVDPQQRLLLEVTWEALESAGIAPTRLRDSSTGVYVGLSTYDYAHLQIKSRDPTLCDAYYGTGTAASVASGRIAYTLGLRGPAISIDTACSSSLVALHLACRALRSGECDLALVGGVNLILSPEAVISMCQSRMMAADGRCKTFDAAADGFGQAEGCAVVVIKRLSDAVSDGDQILAVVRGTAVNQDGGSSGLTAPSGPAQQAVIRAALADAGLQPQDIAYVEAHGTGTRLGDPIEVQALAAVLGAERTADQPLWIGSIKTNLGHLEAAAGLAGLLKVVLALQHRQIPAHLNFRNPNPLIPWDKLPVRVADHHMPLVPIRSKRIAALSSFGFSGTNAHVLIEEAPIVDVQLEQKVLSDRPLQILTLSARSEHALLDLARRYQLHLSENPQNLLADVAYSANTGRSPAEFRLAVIANNAAEVGSALEAHAGGKASAALRSTRLENLDSPRIAFLFTGQGAQYLGMGHGLFKGEPVFRAAFEQCDELFSQYLKGSVRELLYGLAGDRAKAQRELDQTQWTQPALFTVEWAMMCLWRSWGIEPALVIGHSIGEYVAACASGVFSLDDAVRSVAARSRLMSQLPEGGAMATVMCSEETVLKLIAKIRDVSLAAVNGPQSTVISGAESGLAEAERQLRLARIASLRLTVSHGFHSALLEPMLEEFEGVIGSVPLRNPSVTLISNLTGRAVRNGEVNNGTYWRHHARAPVRFADCLNSAYDLGYRTFVEVGPKPILSSFVGQSLSKDCVCLPSLSDEQDPWPRLLGTLRELYLKGSMVDWVGFDRPFSRRKVSLPTYPFQRQRFWLDGQSPRHGTANAAPMTRTLTMHPHLEHRFDTALGEVMFETRLDPSRHPYLADHVVHGEIVLSAAFYLEVIAAAVREVFSGSWVALENVTIHEAVRVPSTGVEIQLIVSPNSGTNGQFQLFSRHDARAWRPSVNGQFSSQLNHPRGVIDGGSQHAAEPARPTVGQSVIISEFYAVCDHIGLNFGPSFRGLRRLQRSDNEATGEIELPASAGSSAGFGLHPAALDACLQAMAAALAGFPAEVNAVYMPIGIDRFESFCHGDDQLTSRVWLEPDTAAETRVGHAIIENVAGVAIARVHGLRLKRAPKSALAARQVPLDECFYEVRWETSSSSVDAPKESALASVAWAPDVAELNSRFINSSVRYGLSAAAGHRHQLDAVCLAYVAQALRKLGWATRVGERFTLVQLIEELGIVPRHGRLIRRLVEWLVEDGILQPQSANNAAEDERHSAEAWVALRELPHRDPSRLLTNLLEQIPTLRSELLFTQRGGSHLAEALHGQIDPTEILFPNGSFELANDLYRKSSSALVFNDLVRAVVARAIEKIPFDRQLRILEIGSGTGGVTSAVLPILPAERTKYTFTDLSTAFFRKAAEEFAAFPFVNYRMLDIEIPPAEQGFAGEKFDLVIASNVLHATADIGLALDHVRSVLLPGAQLLVLEGVRPQRWIDLSFGLTRGWWKFADVALRDSYPLLSSTQWRELLIARGFADVVILPGGEARAKTCDQFSTSDQALILSRVESANTNSSSRLRPADGVLIFADSQGVAEELQSRLLAGGASCSLVYSGKRFQKLAADAFCVDPTRFEDFRLLLDELLKQGRLCNHIVYLWPIDCHAAGVSSAAELSAQLERCCGSLLALVQALNLQPGQQSPRLWLVTTRAQAVVANETMNGLAQASVWGLGKVIALEHPELRCVRIDIETSGDVEWLLSELAQSGEEPLVAYREGRRYVARLVRIADGKQRRAVTPEQLVIVERGTPAGVALRPAVRLRPEPGQVEIEVRAAGLNFRDVLNILGTRDDAAPLGGEVAGVITALGEGVEALRVGDEVVAVTHSGFSSYAYADAELVLPKPANLDFATAAASPLAYLTAHYALNSVGRMRKGERVLIHAAAGGVGLAAVELAQRQELQVIATAGSPAKREFLRANGVDQVFDSRLPAFADEIRLATQGEGVDLVLNSLTGSAIAASLGVLRPNGRFLEIGKSQIWSAAQVAAVNSRVEYCAIDLAALITQNPKAVRRSLVELFGQLSDGRLRPLPVRTFPLSAASEAIEHMSRAKHIGKVVLVPAVPKNTTHDLQPAPVQLRADATYLISGGLTGLGLAASEWLVRSGARTLLLFGRHAPSAKASLALDALRARGARIVVVQADVSREADVRGLFEGPLGLMPPLRGVIHSAGHLEDNLLTQQNWTSFARALAPKAIGAWLLHQMTAELPLDFFVMFSSASALLGAVGQANHAAANAFLDMLAYYRRARRLSAVSINWGAWAEIGAAAERNVGQRIIKHGIGELTSEEGFEALELVLLGQAPQVGVIRADWSKLNSTLHNPAEQKFFERLASTRAPVATERAPVPVAARELHEATLEKRFGLLLKHVRAQVASVIGLSPRQPISDKQPFRDMGLDSLMAVELRNRLRIGLGIEQALPATLVFDHPSVASLAEYLATNVYGWETTRPVALGANGDMDALDVIERMSEADVERVFSRRSGSNS